MEGKTPARVNITSPTRNEKRGDSSTQPNYLAVVSFNEVIQELPALTFAQRQELVRRVVALDDPPLSPADEALVESRLEALHDAPASALSLEEMKARLRARHS